MTASICMDCGGPCTAHGHPLSHGLCDHCQAKRYPNWPSSKRHAEAMSRGAEAFKRGRAEQIKRLDSFGAKP